MSRIKFLVMDVDGTLTDGKIYMGNDGEAMKAFNIKDGLGIHNLLPDAGIIPVIITGRESKITHNRCKEIGIEFIFQGISDKVTKLKEFLTIQGGLFSEVAYAGDDLNDLACIEFVKKNGGVVGVPANACRQVKNHADFVSNHVGGDGAVRDFIEFLVANNAREVDDNNLEEQCLVALEYIFKLKEEDLSLGRHNVNENFYYIVQEYETNTNVMKHFESHCKYVDIQMLILGVENLQVVDTNELKIEAPYDEVKERILYYPTTNPASIVMRPRSAVVLYPKDAHRSMAYNGKPSKVKKVVGKVKIK